MLLIGKFLQIRVRSGVGAVAKYWKHPRVKFKLLRTTTNNPVDSSHGICYISYKQEMNMVNVNAREIANRDWSHRAFTNPVHNSRPQEVSLDTGRNCAIIGL
jgi:hypothetical protein